MKFSIIVPVYNCEKLLHISVDSILNQTSDDWELILVNDGSTDNSYALCQNYVKKDNRIKCINQKNNGPSIARNNGLNKAAGEYIIFCDSDDFIDYTALEKIENEMKKNKYDIVFFGYYDAVIHNGDLCKKTKHLYPKTKIDNNKAFKNIYIELDSLSYTYPVWNKAYNAQFLKVCNAAFPSGINVAEDFVFNLQIYTKAKNVLIINECFYYYIQHKNSITGRFMLSKINDVEYVYQYALSIMRAWNPAMENKLHNNYLNDISVYVNNMFNKESALLWSEKRKTVNEIINRSSVRQCIKSVLCSSKRNKLVKWLIKYKCISLFLLTGKIARIGK